jgi:hypothetical protein
MWPLLTLGLLGVASEPPACLPPDPATVTLSGVLERQTSPGPPNYDSIAAGDAPETYFVLHLDQPVCLSDLPDNPASLIQLVFNSSSAQSYESLRPWLGQPMTCNGKLFWWQTGHHHTPILLTVTSCSAIAPP